MSDTDIRRLVDSLVEDVALMKKVLYLAARVEWLEERINAGEDISDWYDRRLVHLERAAGLKARDAIPFVDEYAFATAPELRTQRAHGPLVDLAEEAAEIEEMRAVEARLPRDMGPQDACEKRWEAGGGEAYPRTQRALGEETPPQTEPHEPRTPPTE